MNLEIEAKIENIDAVVEFVNNQLESMGCSLRAQTQIDIALDELFSNICHYAYKDQGIVGLAMICVKEVPEENSAQITISDEGIPFNPLNQDDPDVTLGLEERGIGGLGIFMVKKTMNDIKYEYRDGKNILTVIKTL